MYLLYYEDEKRIANYRDLKTLVLEEIDAEIYNNETMDNDDVTARCIKDLQFIAKNGDTFNEEYYIQKLNEYGWGVINLTKIAQDLSILEEFIARKGDYSFIRKVIDYLYYDVQKLRGEK